MRKLLIIFVFFIGGCAHVFSVENYPAGARSLGLSQAFVSFSDVWSTFHNQAGLAGIKNTSAAIFYESRFLIDELSFASGTLVLPVKTGTFGLSFYQFGKGSFKENKAGLAFAKQLSGKISAGIQLDFFSYRFPENERSKGTATFEAGIIYNPVERLFLGVHVFNPVFSTIKSDAKTLIIPATIRIGGHFQFYESGIFTVETEKGLNQSVLVKSGIEFSPVKNLALRWPV